jgi:hypothetical protein
MCRLLHLSLLLAAFPAPAGNVRLAWDPSPDTNVVSYAIYAGTNSGNYFIRLAVGTNLTCTVSNLSAYRWYFVATAATVEGIESLPSNEVQCEVPKAPANMRTVVLQYGNTLTNFYDVGFFKLRLP